jgi:hypothetical protein
MHPPFELIYDHERDMPQWISTAPTTTNEKKEMKSSMATISSALATEVISPPITPLTVMDDRVGECKDDIAMTNVMTSSSSSLPLSSLRTCSGSSNITMTTDGWQAQTEALHRVQLEPGEFRPHPPARTGYYTFDDIKNKKGDTGGNNDVERGDMKTNTNASNNSDEDKSFQMALASLEESSSSGRQHYRPLRFVNELKRLISSPIFPTLLDDQYHHDDEKKKSNNDQLIFESSRSADDQQDGKRSSDNKDTISVVVGLTSSLPLSGITVAASAARDGDDEEVAGMTLFDVKILRCLYRTVQCCYWVNCCDLSDTGPIYSYLQCRRRYLEIDHPDNDNDGNMTLKEDQQWLMNPSRRRHWTDGFEQCCYCPSIPRTHQWKWRLFFSS